MSRWSYDPPDTDRYEPTPVEDVDVPDFTEPDPPVDPAEHAAHALIDALTTFEQQIVLATMLPDSAKALERLYVLRKISKRAEQHAMLVNGKCAAAIDTLLGRR